MKKFENHVRWNFKISMAGYGRNCKEALEYALEQCLQELPDWTLDDSLQSIETHEVTSIDENDFIKEPTK